MLRKIIVLACVLFLAQAARVNFRACSGGLPVPNWVESDECPNDRCQLRRGQVFHARTEVVPQEGFTNLFVDLSATWLGLPFPVQIPAGYDNACNFLEAGATCPVQAGSTYIWGIQAPINSSYPAAPGVNMQIRAGENGRWAACAIVTADIV